MRPLKKNLPSHGLERPVSWSRALLAIGASIMGASTAFAAPSTTVVISQVYGGGGNGGATYTNDFVELHNISASSVSLNGWSLQYASATGTSWNNTTALTGSIPPGGYFLVQQAAGAGTALALPTPDQIGAINLSGTNGKIALLNSTTLLGAGDFTGTAPTNPTIVDFVGFGSANNYEGTGAVGVLSNSTAAIRANSGTMDTDVNSADFTVGTPAPRNGATAVFPADTVAPTLVSLTPADDATGVGVGLPLAITLSEPIFKGTGNITVRLSSNNSAVFTVDVTTSAVTVSGQTATINLPGALVGNTAYYVTVDSGAFKDAANFNFAGITANTAWSFTTANVDNTPPAVVTLLPADNATGVNPASNLTVTYSENIIVGTGNILLKKSSDNSIVETIAVTGPRVTIAAQTLVIDPTAPLDFNVGYYVEIPSGVVKDSALNPNAAISGATAWNFTTRAQSPVLISQYYEGVGVDRYIELVNTTNAPISLNGYRLTAWSASDSGNQAWKTGTATTPRVTALDGFTIPANGHFLVANSAAVLPEYAAATNDIEVNSDAVEGNPGVVAFNGSQSIVLYSGATNDLANIADALSFISGEGVDKSFYRANNLVGFDFSTGTTILNYPTTWATATLAAVASAVDTAPEYLKATKAARFLQLTIAPASFSEGAGTGAATATITRSGATTEEAAALVVANNSYRVAVPEFVFFEAGQGSITFPIDAVNDAYLNGDAVVSINVSADGYVSDTKTVTVLDEPTDLPFPIVINELDADQTDLDTGEFVELYNNSSADLPLDGVVMVLYNGNGNTSYLTVDLSGQVIPANGFFVVGNETVPNASITFANNTLQNGADGVALYFGLPGQFPNATVATTTAGKLIDAVVYTNGATDGAGLVTALTPGKVVVNENGSTTGPTSSIGRSTDGGASFASELYVVMSPTPGAANVASTGSGFGTWAAANAGGEAPLGDFDNDGVKNGVEYFFGATGSTFTPSPAIVAGKVSYPRDATATGVTYAVKTSTNLVTWTAVATVIEGNFVTYTLPTGQGKIFVRLEVEVTP